MSDIDSMKPENPEGARTGTATATEPMGTVCAICRGEMWVCENHLDQPWGDGDACCGGAGTNCICNPTGEFSRGTQVLANFEAKGYLS